MSYIIIIYILLINTNVPWIHLLILHKNGKITVCISFKPQIISCYMNIIHLLYIYTLILN